MDPTHWLNPNIFKGRENKEKKGAIQEGEFHHFTEAELKQEPKRFGAYKKSRKARETLTKIKKHFSNRVPQQQQRNIKGQKRHLLYQATTNFTILHPSKKSSEKTTSEEEKKYFPISVRGKKEKENPPTSKVWAIQSPAFSPFRRAGPTMADRLRRRRKLHSS